MKERRLFSERVFVVNDLEAWRGWPPDYEEKMVIAPEGFFVVKREELLTHVRPATLYDLERLLGYRNRAVQSVGRVELPVCIPFALVTQAAAFFKEVWRRYKREDVLLLYFFFEEQRFEFRHPELISADTQGVRYDHSETPAAAVRLGSFHSHGDNEASHSGEDWCDDVASPGVHVVIGRVDQATPTIRCFASDGSTCYPVRLADVFECSPQPSFPNEWLVEGVPRLKNADLRQHRAGEDQHRAREESCSDVY